MIQSLFVRAIAPRLAGGLVFFAAEMLIRAAHADVTAAVYWQPPDAAALGVDARAAFSAAAASMGARFVDATPAEPCRPVAGAGARRRQVRVRALRVPRRHHRPRCPAARRPRRRRRRSRRPSAVGDLPLPRPRQARGHGDRRRCVGRPGERGPPRSDARPRSGAVPAARCRRVQAGGGRSGSASRAPTWLLEVPPDAVVHVDGARTSSAASITLGQHFVSVTADGFERWAAVVSVASDPTRFKPPIHPHRPPPVDKIAALAGAPEPQRLLVGMLERTPGGWTFTVRDIPLPDGRIVSDSVALGDVPTRAAVARPGAPPAPAACRRRATPPLAALGARRVCGRRWSAPASPSRSAETASPNVVGDLGRWR